jgi:hypothetical protein
MALIILFSFVFSSLTSYAKSSEVLISVDQEALDVLERRISIKRDFRLNKDLYL